MPGRAFAAQPVLLSRSRLPTLSRSDDAMTALEWAALVGIGALAACAVTFWDWKVKLPGHAILRAVFPMSFGLALAPRRVAGSIMGASALLTTLLLGLGGVSGPGAGAMTSLCLTGPILDAAVALTRRSGRVYLGLACAGLVSNLAALAVRAAGKHFGFESGGGSWATWWPRAVISYPLCGLAAGLLSAVVWFQFKQRKGKSPQDGADA